MTTATSQDKEKKKATKTQPKERPSRDPSDFQTPVAPAFPNFFLLPPLFLRLSRWRNPTVTIRPGFLRALMSRWHTDRTDSPDNPHAHQNHRIVLNASPPTHAHPSNHAGHVQGLRNLASSCCFSIAPRWTNLRIYLFFLSRRSVADSNCFSRNRCNHCYIDLAIYHLFPESDSSAL